MRRILSFLFLISILPGRGEEIWMFPPASPDGRCLRELFTRPDEWKETRANIRVLGYADHMLRKQFTDEELGAWLPKLKEWNIELGLEVGCVKPWGTTAQEAFDKQRKHWDRFQALGGQIGVLTLDEPLVCSRNDLKLPDTYAMEETAKFIALVRQHYPGVRVGDIEAYPFASVPDLIAFIDGVESRLKTMGVRGMDFFQIDVDWVHFVMDHPGGWTEVRKLEEACRARKIPFSLLYWAADYGHLKRHNLAGDSTWYLGVMRQAHDYLIVGGRPDIKVVESWVGAPSRAVPEDAEWTFSRSVLDFSQTFAERSNPAQP